MKEYHYKSELYIIKHELWDGTNRKPQNGDEFTIYVFDSKGNIVASAGFLHQGSAILPDDHHGDSVSVAKDHQRKGLATEMYKYAEYISETGIIRSSGQTEDGKSFWNQKNRNFGKN